MKALSSSASHFRILPLAAFLLVSWTPLAAEPVPLKRMVELALGHSTTTIMATADERRTFASYREARNAYIPQFIVGSGLGKSWGFPLSLEGSAPSIVNFNTQSSLLNPALRDFVRAAKTEWQANTLQSKDQRNQVIQDTVASYVELAKWEGLLSRLHQREDQAVKTEQAVNDRIQAGVDSPVELTKARLVTARARWRIAQAQGSADVLRKHLAQLTGLPASSIETVAESIPPLPDPKPEDDLSSQAVQSSPAVQVAEQRALAQSWRARGEHRALWPSMDFASQYALLARYNNYGEFFKTFQRHNATIGIVMRFPFLSPSQKARAEAADTEALRAKKAAQATRDQVAEETLRLQRGVAQAAAARDVADLEYQVAQSNLEAVQARVDAATATFHELEDARNQANERYVVSQDAAFELDRVRISLLRATGELEKWALGGS